MDPLTLNPLTEPDRDMADLHWNFISAAYGLTALCLLVEWLLLRSARHQTLARIAREHELEEDTP